MKVILDGSRKAVLNHLRNSGCRDNETAVGIFHDALLKFLTMAQAGQFEGNDIKSTVAFLKKAAFFIWSKHQANPKREAMKRGQSLAVMQGTASEVVGTMHDPMDGTGNPALLGIQSEPGTAAAKTDELKLSEKIKKIIDELSGECQERVRRMKFFHQDGEEKITHEETASDLGDPSPKASRKKQDGCLKKLKQLVAEAWSQDVELRGLIQLKI